MPLGRANFFFCQESNLEHFGIKDFASSIGFAHYVFVWANFDFVFGKIKLHDGYEKLLLICLKHRIVSKPFYHFILK